MQTDWGLGDLAQEVTSGEDPVLLYRRGAHEIHWVGAEQESVLRCNSYLLRDGEENILIDPGGRAQFEQTLEHVSRLCPAQQITGMVISHQDPDTAASMVDWLAINPTIQVFTHPRIHLLLPHYGVKGYALFPAEQGSQYKLPSGARLQFINAPFMHSPGAITVYDTDSKYLLSSDIWAAITPDWQLVVGDFKSHKHKLDLFHVEYMTSNIAARGFVRSIERLNIQAILPQHGEIIPAGMIQQALDYLRELRCGTDLLYADLRT